MTQGKTLRSFAWYAQRLRAMTPREIAWRARSALRDACDRSRYLVMGRIGPRPARNGDRPRLRSDLRLCALPVGAWKADSSSHAVQHSLDGLRDYADKAAAGRLSFFALTDHDFGKPVDWNRDHRSGKAAPRAFAPSIDYRDFDVTGDCKYVWELNRHHHLVVLSRAYRATGDRRYAEAVVEQLTGWLDQCPFGLGMNWRSPMELGIRLVNWVWAIELIRPSGLITGEFESRLLHAAHLHVWDIARKYSRGSSANNHLIGEALGVFVGASYFSGMPEAAIRRAESREILIAEILAQTYPDGVGREHALGYHHFILEMFLIAAIVARADGTDFPVEYWSRLEKMLEFSASLLRGGPELPSYGDCDDGYVLDLGAPRDPRALLAIGSALLGRDDFARLSGNRYEPVAWLFGAAAVRRVAEQVAAGGSAPLRSEAFPHAGYYLLQHGRSGAGDAISVFFDCGDLGYGTIAAHGHADALSFTLRVGGVEVLVDPGTYDYFTYPDWREYFRTTRAHNTVEVDGMDQSERVGRFQWGRRARARCIAWMPDDAGGRVIGEHDGYARLSAPVTHRREISLDGAARRLRVEDRIIGHGSHAVAICFHFAAGCRVERIADGNRFHVAFPAGHMTMTMDPRLAVAVVCGGDASMGGWVSRGYHQKDAATALIGRCNVSADEVFWTSMELDN